MTKQELARKRNYFKFIITGLPKPVDMNILSSLERAEWVKILEARKLILERFNETSKVKGLNVIIPCWCGSRRKTKCDEEYCQINLIPTNTSNS
jgi:hypothetical protein